MLHVDRRALLAGLAASLTCGQAKAEKPARVAVLDWGLASTLIGLGIVPVGLAEIAGYRDWVVEPAVPAGVQDLGLRLEPNAELLLELAPDLIVMSPQMESLRPMLERIAPTQSYVTFDADRRPLDRAIGIARSLGTLFDREGAAEALIQAYEQAHAGLERTLSGRAGRDILIIAFQDARHVRVFGKGSLFGDVIERAGGRLAWGGPVNFWGFSLVGLAELASLGDGDVISIEPIAPETQADLDRSEFWAHLPFVVEHRVTTIPPVWTFGEVTAATRFARALTATLRGQADAG